MTGDALLQSIGVTAYSRASAVDKKYQTLTLFDAATPAEGVVRWTEYVGGLFNTRGGVSSWNVLGNEACRIAFETQTDVRSAKVLASDHVPELPDARIQHAIFERARTP